MPSTQELLQAITGMQQNAQAALPVIPNNGNPQGANNMPSNPDATAPDTTATSPYFYDWMKPSPAVDLIHKMLSAPLQPPINGGVMAPPVQLDPTKGAGVVAPPSDHLGPVMPARNHAWRDARLAARQDGDFMNPLMQERLQRPEQQQVGYPIMPYRPGNY